MDIFKKTPIKSRINRPKFHCSSQKPGGKINDLIYETIRSICDVNIFLRMHSLLQEECSVPKEC